MSDSWRNELITKGAAFDALTEVESHYEFEDGHDHLMRWAKTKIFALPSEQPQLDTCPIYGGMCGYPSNLCYECPRHEGAKERPQWWTEGLQPFAQPQPCKDAVSKANVLETYAELYDVFDDNKEIKNELHKIYDKINALQAAQPQHEVRFSDADHVWIDGKQYISLRRFMEAVKDARKDAYKHGKSKGIKRGMAIAKRKHEE